MEKIEKRRGDITANFKILLNIATLSIRDLIEVSQSTEVLRTMTTRVCPGKWNFNK